MDSTERFYRTQAPAYLQQNGVQNYMKYVSMSPGCIKGSENLFSHLLWIMGSQMKARFSAKVGKVFVISEISVFWGVF